VIVGCQKPRDQFYVDNNPWNPDIAGTPTSTGAIPVGTITSVGQFEVVNVNQAPVSQFIYSIDISFKDYEGYIDTIYWKTYLNGSLQTGAIPISDKIHFVINQTVTSGQRTSPLMIGIKRKDVDLGARLISMVPENIQTSFDGVTKDVTPNSQKYNIISFAIN